jgi:NADPH-dependent 2,4-dienoyl-CoA reductase/sulfur reductase-like enzyme/nitrite reductase/ring-hydroxylating ferredoxin subunit
MSSLKAPVCPVDALSIGEMKQFTVQGREILLARKQDGFFAIAAHCSHKGAPLIQGVMSNRHVVCPWHNACFSLQTGALLEPPGCDHLASYGIELHQGTVYVDLPVSKVESHVSMFVEVPVLRKGTVVPVLCQPSEELDDRLFAIVGGGAAASAAAEMLRRKGFRGRLVMLTADKHLPYDRTRLSKGHLQQDDATTPAPLRSADFYAKYGIHVITGATVTHLDTQAQTLTYGEGKTLPYDAVLLATGGQVRQLPIDGVDLPNVFTLRRAEDAAHILKAIQNQQSAVVIGAGFIGMEVAASLRQQGLAVTVVASSQVPFEQVLGREVGAWLQQVHEAQGVTFRLGTKAQAIKGADAVEAVVLDDGETLPADLVVVGIGVTPATDFVDASLLDEGDRSISVDACLQAAPNVYAAGDIAQYPDPWTNQPVRIEHWRLALQQGRTAAQNMLGESVPFQAVPFFWTGQYDLKLRYVGHAETWDEVVIHGSLADQRFLAFYLQGERIAAVAGVGRDRDIAAISELMRLRQMPTAEELQRSDLDWVAALPE